MRSLKRKDGIRNYEKYRNFTQELSFNYHELKFVHISTSSLGIFGNTFVTYIQRYKDIDFEENHFNYILKKSITNIIPTT